MQDLEASVVRPLARKLSKYGEVEDVEQELRIEVWRAQQAYVPGGAASLRTYCWKYALNRVRRIANHHNRQKRTTILTSLDESRSVDNHASDRETTLHDLIIGHDARDSEGSTLDITVLSPGQREAAELIAAGYTMREAGEMLGCSYQAVSQRMAQAKVALTTMVKCQACGRGITGVIKRRKFCANCR